MALLNFTTAPHGGRLRLLPESSAQLPITPRTLIYHSIVGSAQGAFNYFRDRSNLESHFIVTSTGEVWQLIDTQRRADANYQANRWAISVETEDRGDPDTQPWTAQQLDALAWIAAEVNRLHGIPLVKVPRWDGAGIGYHSQYREWSPVVKTCPGVVRVRQFHEVLLPRIVGGRTAQQQEDGMASDEYEALRQQIGHGLARLEQVIKDQTGAIYHAANKQHGDVMELGWRTHNLASADGALLARIADTLDQHTQLLDQHRQLLADMAELFGPARSAAAETEVLPHPPRS